MKYAIDEQSMTDIADAIRGLCHEDDTMTPIQMADKIKSLRLGVPINVTIHLGEDGRWIRPEEYPDLDSIEIPDDFDGLYLTYDLRKTPGYGWIGIYVQNATNSTPYWIERGHLENGVFVADDTNQLTSKTYFRQPLDDTYGDVQLWRIRSESRIVRIGFITNGTTSSQNFQNNIQPCVERRGRLDYVTSLSSDISTSATYVAYATQWLEKDSVIYGGVSKNISLYQTWCQCYSLQELDLSHANTSAWAVTDLRYLFSRCFSLRSLDFSKIDTSNWAVTNVQEVFYYCMSLEKLDFSGIDTSKWKGGSLNNLFAYCYSLKEVTFTGINTSNWNVTSCASTFYYCLSLRSLDFSGFDTSNWTVTRLDGLFNCCTSLEKLNITGINTSNWKVTRCDGVFASCYSLREINLSGIDTINWEVTTIASLFTQCHRIKGLDLSNINTSNWVVASMSAMFSGCYSLESIDLSSFDTSNWAVTSISSMFANCWSLKEIVFGEINTSNWAVTTLDSTFYGCRNLHNLDLSVFDTSNWRVTTLYGTFRDCASLEEVDLSSWNISNFAITDNRYMVAYDSALKTVKFQLGLFTNLANINGNMADSRALINVEGFRIYFNHSYANCLRLSKQSLLNIVNDLPTVSVARTITLGQTNRLKLTAEDIAIATQKGWTVA